MSSRSASTATRRAIFGVRRKKCGCRFPTADRKSNEWRCRGREAISRSDARMVRRVAASADRRRQNTPGCIFNGMIQPLIPFAIRGAIWYQGESNVAHSHEYAAVLTTLIERLASAVARRAVSVLYRATGQPRPPAANSGGRRLGRAARGPMASVAARAEHRPGRDDRHRRRKRHPPAQQARCRQSPGLERAGQDLRPGDRMVGPAIRSDGNARPRDSAKIFARGGRAAWRKGARCVNSRSPAATRNSCGPTRRSRAKAWWFRARRLSIPWLSATRGPKTPPAAISTIAPASRHRPSAPTIGRQPRRVIPPHATRVWNSR